MMAWVNWVWYNLVISVPLKFFSSTVNVPAYEYEVIASMMLHISMRSQAIILNPQFNTVGILILDPEQSGQNNQWM